jgi:hypothetical protein
VIFAILSTFHFIGDRPNEVLANRLRGFNWSDDGQNDDCPFYDCNKASNECTWLEYNIFTDRCVFKVETWGLKGLNYYLCFILILEWTTKKLNFLDLTFSGYPFLCPKKHLSSLYTHLSILQKESLKELKNSNVILSNLKSRPKHFHEIKLLKNNCFLMLWKKWILMKNIFVRKCIFVFETFLIWPFFYVFWRLQVCCKVW